VILGNDCSDLSVANRAASRLKCNDDGTDDDDGDPLRAADVNDDDDNDDVGYNEDSDGVNEANPNLQRFKCFKAI